MEKLGLKSPFTAEALVWANLAFVFSWEFLRHVDDGYRCDIRQLIILRSSRARTMNLPDRLELLFSRCWPLLFA